MNGVASMENLSTCSSVVRSSRRSEGGDSGICLTPHEPCGYPSGILMSPPLPTTSTSPTGTLAKSGTPDNVYITFTSGLQRASNILGSNSLTCLYLILLHVYKIFGVVRH
mgnify:CR=1 FL=1